MTTLIALIAALALASIPIALGWRRTTDEAGMARAMGIAARLKQDIEVMELLDRAAVSYQLVLTKTDKLNPGALAAVEARVSAESRRHGAAHPQLIATSSVTGLGIPELRAELAALAET